MVTDVLKLSLVLASAFFFQINQWKMFCFVTADPFKEKPKHFGIKIKFEASRQVIHETYTLMNSFSKFEN